MHLYRVKKDNRHIIEPEQIFLDKLVHQRKEDGLVVPERLEVNMKIRHLRILLIVAFILVGGFLIRDFWLQIVQYNKFHLLAENNSHRYVFKRALRGIIYDRYHKPLVKNEPTYSLVVIPADLPYDLSILNQEIDKIIKIFNLSKEEIDEALKDKLHSTSIDPVFIKTDIDINEIRQFEAEPEDIKGFSVVEDIKRVYENGPAFANVIGYLGKISEDELKTHPDYSISDFIGKYGLEHYYESFLKGHSGRHIFEVNAQGKIINDAGEIAPQAGYDLITTLDKDLQEYFYQVLLEAANRLGLKKGAGLALNPKTGEILSLVSLPSFDNNLFIKGSPKEQIQKILSDSNQPLFNRVIWGLYAPGSTIKPLVALAALEEKVISPNRVISDEEGKIVIPNPYHPDQPSIFRDWKVHGLVDMRKAIAYSCNIYFYTIGGGYKDIKGLGINLLKKYWQLAGFDKLLGIDFDGEKTGILPDPAWIEKNRLNDPYWRIGDTYNVSIGQGDLSLTPLQILSYISGLANNGKVMRPHLMQTIVDKNNAIIKENKIEEAWDYEVNPNNLKVVQEGMREVVLIGSANSLNSIPFSVAGKTGTPQISSGKKINAFFAAYAPFENPEIAILVLLEEPKEGSVVAIPVAKQVLEWYYLNRYQKSPLD